MLFLRIDSPSQLTFLYCEQALFSSLVVITPPSLKSASFQIFLVASTFDCMFSVWVVSVTTIITPGDFCRKKTEANFQQLWRVQRSSSECVLSLPDLVDENPFCLGPKEALFFRILASRSLVLCLFVSATLFFLFLASPLLWKNCQYA